MTSTRRAFVLGSAAALGAAALPTCRAHPRKPQSLDQPLRLCMIGVGGRGHENLQAMAGETIAVLCDVDSRQLRTAAEQFPAARQFTDFRAIFGDRKLVQQLDAVVVSTPDHTHYPAAVLALQAGLDVYCEKPLTHTVAQARRLTVTAAATGAITQMGTQIHANANYRRVVEAIRAGAIGAVRAVHVFVNGTDWSGAGRPEGNEPPGYLAWDSWLGPAAERPYSDAYHPAGWRRYWAFGGGTTADMGCHFMDLAFWALELTAPTLLKADGPEPDAEGAPTGMSCEYRFPAGAGRPPVSVSWWCGASRPTEELAPRGLDGWRDGVLFVGAKGFLISNYDRHELGPKADFANWQPPPPTLPDPQGHHAEWLRGCKQRAQPSCHFGYAGPLTETVLLANAAYRGARGQVLTWQPDVLQLLGGVRAQALLDEPVRHGWPA
jgi:predicted dehydrogenase